MSNDPVERVSTREDIAEFLRELHRELEANPDEWENSTLEAFLEALSSVIDDMDGWFANRGEPVPDQPTWRLVAPLPHAARVYE
jgi:hypothetical protein